MRLVDYCQQLPLVTPTSFIAHLKSAFLHTNSFSAEDVDNSDVISDHLELACNQNNNGNNSSCNMENDDNNNNNNNAAVILSTKYESIDNSILFTSVVASDVTFIVEGQALKAHRYYSHHDTGKFHEIFKMFLADL